MTTSRFRSIVGMALAGIRGVDISLKAALRAYPYVVHTEGDWLTIKQENCRMSNRIRRHGVKKLRINPKRLPT